MKQLIITEAKARQLYKNANPEVQALLEETFGEGYLNGMIENFNDVVRLSQKDFHDRFAPEYEKDDEFAFRQLKLITEVLNKGWWPDWNDKNQMKWFVYFGTLAAANFTTNQFIPSSLVLKNLELAQFAAVTFPDIYKAYYS